MKNQFVPYNIALKLKELGFDEECFDYYVPKGKAISDIFNNNFELKKYNSETNHIYGYVGLVSRPLWQQAIDWFREKHNLHIQLHYNTQAITWEYRVYMLNEFIHYSPHNKVYFNTEAIYKTYYDSLTAAILKAINLIKNE